MLDQFTSNISVQEKKERTMQEEMELQLHQQYAENNNAYFGSIVAFIGVLLGVIAAYGYVYIRTSLYFSKDFGSMVDCFDNYTMDALILTSIAAMLVVLICHHICVERGVAQRKEQFIIDSIRRHYYGDTLNKDRKWLPNTYHPYEKESGEIIQGLYNLFRRILYWTNWIIFITVMLKVGASFNNHCLQFMLVLCFLILALSFIYKMYLFQSQQMCKYIEIQKEYIEERKARHEHIPTKLDLSSFKTRLNTYCICDYLCFLSRYDEEVKKLKDKK